MFYTYAHHREDDGKIFYIGKGKGSRCLSSKNRNRYWKHIVAKHGFKSEILAKWPTEKEALEHEKFLILCFKDMGYQLANLTYGGDGVSGYKWTEDQKKSHGLAQKERAKNPKLTEIKSKLLSERWKNPEFRKSRNSHFLGDKNPSRRPEVREKLGIAGYLQKNAKKVRCIETNVVFNTLKDASDWAASVTGKSPKTGISKSLNKSSRSTSYGFHWEYI